MIIKTFKIRHEASENWTELNMNNNTCLIYSAGNSTGKTTLIRAILHCFGFAIPNTELVNFDRYEFELSIIDNKKDIIIYRHKNLLRIDGKDYDLPIDSSLALSQIFRTNNPELLSNLLATIYFDQDKGWTLLNRGTIVGINRFNIESFFRGLKGDESEETYRMVERIKYLEQKISEYELLENISEYRDSIMLQSNNPSLYFDNKSNPEIELEEARIFLHNVELEIAEINNILKNNKQFIDYIEMKNILVKNPLDENKPIPVNRHNILYFDDLVSLSESRRTILINKRNEYKKRIAELEAKTEQQAALVNVDSLNESIKESIRKIETANTGTIQSVKKDYIKERNELSAKLESKTKFNNPWIDEAYMLVKKYFAELEISADIKIDLFTRKLKSKSGAILHKMVFSFKLAYISLLSKKLGVNLPIICDSPNGREVEKNTVEKSLRILKRDFADHQLICASIYKHESILKKPLLIELDGTLFDAKRSLLKNQ